MRTFRVVSIGLIAVLFAAASAAFAEDSEPTARPEAPARSNPAEARTEALELLEEMSDFLSRQKSFRMKSENSYDAMQPRGLRLEFGGENEVLLRRPDHLRIDREDREGEKRTFRYDGETVSLMFEEENAYVQVEHVGTIESMLDYVVDELHMPMPLSDLLDRNFYAGIAERVRFAAIVGQSRIDDQLCTHAVYRSRELDFQLWVTADDEPLPCRIVITYRDRPGEPQFRARFLEWKLGVWARDKAFRFDPPDDAERLAIGDFARKEADE